MAWLVVDIDAGVLGAYPTRKAALAETLDGGNVRRYGSSRATYEYQVTYPGEEGGYTYHLVPDDWPRAQADGFEWAIELWEAAGRPMGRFPEALAEPERLESVVNRRSSW